MPVITLTYRDDNDCDDLMHITATVQPPDSPLAMDYLKVFHRKLKAIDFGYADFGAEMPYANSPQGERSYSFSLRRNRELPFEDQYKTGRCILRNFCEGFNFANQWYYHEPAQQRS